MKTRKLQLKVNVVITAEVGEDFVDTNKMTLRGVDVGLEAGPLDDLYRDQDRRLHTGGILQTINLLAVGIGSLVRQLDEPNAQAEAYKRVQVALEQAFLNPGTKTRGVFKNDSVGFVKEERIPISVEQIVNHTTQHKEPLIFERVDPEKQQHFNGVQLSIAGLPGEGYYCLVAGPLGQVKEMGEVIMNEVNKLVEPK